MTISRSSATPGRSPLRRYWPAGTLVLLVAIGVRGVHEGRSRSGHTRPATALRSDADLIAQLGEEEHEATAAGAALIERLGPRALPIFLDHLDHARPSTRAIAVESVVELADANDQRPMAAVRRRLSDYDALVRMRVIEGIRRLDANVALPILLGALGDEDEWIREAAARQVGEVRARAAVGPLIQALDDPHPNVVGLATAALRRITGQPIRYSYIASAEQKRRALAAWRAWWQKNRAAWPTAPSSTSVAISQTTPAPDFEARDLAGRTWRLADLRGRVVLLNFFGSWCFPCVQEMPGMANLQRRYASRGLQILGLAVAEKSEAELRRFAESRRLPFPVGIAPEPVLEAYGDIHEVPVSLLIDRDGRIRRRWEGDRTERTFEAALLAVHGRR